MTIFQAIVLGIVQGITEAFPISSSGHLIFFPQLFGWAPQAYDFDVIIHLATLLAIVWVLKTEVIGVAKGVFQKNSAEGKLGFKIILATIPAVIVGLIISLDFVDEVRVISVVAFNLILWGVVLWIADWYGSKRVSKYKEVEKTTWAQSIIIGISQALALIPGTSRSGITMSAGMFAGLDRETSARFSFLLAIPAVAGAGVLTFFDVIQSGFSTPLPAMIAGFITAFVFGVIAMKLLLKLLVSASFKWFAIYRIILGILIFVFLV